MTTNKARIGKSPIHTIETIIAAIETGGHAILPQIE